MANEITYASLTDLRVSEVLSGLYLLKLADRNALPNHPAIHYAGDASGSGSTTVKIPAIGWIGYDALAEVNETVATTNTALTDEAITVTVARQSKQYQDTQLAALTGSINFLSNPQAFVDDAFASQMMRLTDMICNVTDDYTTQEIETEVNLTVAKVMSAAIKLDIAKADTGQALLLLHPQQWGDVKTDLLTSTAGAVQWSASTQEQILVKGPGYQGRFFNMDVFTSSYVPTATGGEDRAGAIITPGAVVYADATPVPDGDANKLFMGKVVLAREFAASTDMRTTVFSAYMGVSKGLDAAGVTIISDA